MSEVGRADHSIDAYQQALALRPDHVEGWQSLGRAFVAARRFDDAIESLQRGLALVEQRERKPGAPAARLARSGHALYVAERRVEAAEHLRSTGSPIWLPG